MRTLRSVLIALAALFCFTAPAHAGDGVLSPAEVQQRAQAQYVRILAGLAANGRLDDDTVALQRVRRIFPGLVASAPAATAGWSWEAHVTSDPQVDALCVPGGKLLIGSRFVARLALDDAELATLIAHEAAHAIAGHRHPASPESMEMDVSERLRLADIAFQQEGEADEIGMALAYRAGWPVAGMLRFYEKLAASEGQGAFSATHPRAASRLERAREFAAALMRQGGS